MKRWKILYFFISAIMFIGVVFVVHKHLYPSEDRIKVFTAFFDVPGESRDEDNIMKEIIAQNIGAKCDELFLSTQTKEHAMNSYIASGEYPDFISGSHDLYEVDALIPLDEYWDDYPNIKNFLTPATWDRVRVEDGHVYWMPQFGVVNGEDSELIHEGEAFWIQTRVLQWAGYPEVTTLTQYFDLIENYMAANPTMQDGIENIPFTILCDDWRYFCLENVPQFLDGYPNDGSCIVDPITKQVRDYNVTETAKEYFKVLNEKYHKGIIDPESFTNTYEEYLTKLSSGAVLGMVDQWWQFAYGIAPAYERQGLELQGCSYVPLPITIDGSVKNQWNVKRSNELDIATGVAITKSCDDIAGALQFINDLLEPDTQILRFWGIEGEDYEVDENGYFYRTQEQREKQNQTEYINSYYCSYSYFPRLEGMSADGKNYFAPEYQPDEFHATLPTDVKECLDAYGCKTYVDMIGSNEQPGEWYPMYSYSSMLTTATEAGVVWKNMTETKQELLPRVVMADDFEAMWNEYMIAYESCNPSVFFEDMQRELERIIGK